MSKLSEKSRNKCSNHFQWCPLLWALWYCNCFQL